MNPPAKIFCCLFLIYSSKHFLSSITPMRVVKKRMCQNRTTVFLNVFSEHLTTAALRWQKQTGMTPTWISSKWHMFVFERLKTRHGNIVWSKQTTLNEEDVNTSQPLGNNWGIGTKTCWPASSLCRLENYELMLLRGGIYSSYSVREVGGWAGRNGIFTILMNTYNLKRVITEVKTLQSKI